MDILDIQDVSDNCYHEEKISENNLGKGREMVFDYKAIAHLPKTTASDFYKPMKTTLLWDLITDDNIRLDFTIGYPLFYFYVMC